MDLREISFGVEIETVKRTRERVARAIQSVVGGEVRHTGRPVSFDPWEVVDDQGRTWKVVSDGSLINVPGHLRADSSAKLAVDYRNCFTESRLGKPVTDGSITLH